MSSPLDFLSPEYRKILDDENKIVAEIESQMNNSDNYVIDKFSATSFTQRLKTCVNAETLSRIVDNKNLLNIGDNQREYESNWKLIRDQIANEDRKIYFCQQCGYPDELIYSLLLKHPNQSLEDFLKLFDYKLTDTY